MEPNPTSNQVFSQPPCHSKIITSEAEADAEKQSDTKYVGVRPLSELERQLIKSKEASDAKLKQLEAEMEEVKRLTLQKRAAPAPPASPAAVVTPEPEKLEDQSTPTPPSTDETKNLKDLETEVNICWFQNRTTE